MVFSPRLTAVVSLVVYAHAALASIQYPASVVGAPDAASLNFTELFAAYGGDLSNEAWTRSSWHGLTTFVHAPPLRCFGEDAGVPFDVAVLGAPFDTATSFRPG